MSAESCGCDSDVNWVCNRHRKVVPVEVDTDSLVRKFDTGATRSAQGDKLEYEGFLSPAALEVFAQYMHKHRLQADGSLRAPDNWQKGIPLESYVRSLVRHTIDLWAFERGVVTEQVNKDFGEDAKIKDVKLALASAIWFNIQGYIVETLKRG